MSPKAKRWVRRVVVVVGLPVLLYVTWILYWRVPGYLDFLLHHRRYEEIAQAMKSRPPLGEEREDHLSFGAIRASSERDAAGQYSITIVTADWGHRGKAGYLFADQPPTRIEGDPYSNVRAPGDLWMLEGQVAPHWWMISNHLQ
jgi:hypothetical protein